MYTMVCHSTCLSNELWSMGLCSKAGETTGSGSMQTDSQSRCVGDGLGWALGQVGDRFGPDGVDLSGSSDHSSWNSRPDMPPVVVQFCTSKSAGLDLSIP